MLLSFNIGNYKSFKENAIIQMVSTPKQKDLNYSILEANYNNKSVRALSTSVIYGPNASGKSNIIGALEVFQEILSKGHIRNSDNFKDHNLAVDKLELIPNNTLDEVKPVYFSISFIHNNQKFDYILELDLGYFLDTEYKRSILSEVMNLNDKEVFNRMKNKVAYNPSFLFAESISDNKLIQKLIDQSIKSDELFLTNGFKNIMNNSMANEFTLWMKEKLTVIYRADSKYVTAEPGGKKKIKRDMLISNVANAFGSCAEQIIFYSPKEGETAHLASVVKNMKNKKEYVVPSEILESYGTIRFLTLFPLIHKAFKNGGTILIDEFDASIHPMALLNIINIFHNDELNTKNAQLIFNTHNPIFLNRSVFRRDEIKFVERDEKNSSIIYSLADFGTSGKNSVRKTEDYMKNYFMNKYGAIKDIDFTAFFESDLEGESEERN